MSTEQPVQRWFTGLEGLEQLAAEVQLRVYGTDLVPTSYPPRTTLHLPVDEVARIGLRLVGPTDGEAIAEAVEKSHLPADAVKVVAVAEDRFLKERLVVLGPVAATEFRGEVLLTKVDDERHDVFADSFNGFELSLVYILDRDLEAVIARRPHRRGTILARSVWTVRGQRDAEGLNPLPLTPEVRKSANLPASALLYVECDGDLLSTEDLSPIRVYVHEGLLKRLAQARGADRTTVLQQLAIDALVQVARLIAEELEEGAVWDGESSGAMRLLHGLLASCGTKVKPAEFAEFLRTKPQKVAAIISGAQGQAARLMKMFDDADQVEEPA